MQSVNVKELFEPPIAPPEKSAMLFAKTQPVNVAPPPLKVTAPPVPKVVLPLNVQFSNAGFTPSGMEIAPPLSPRLSRIRQFRNTAGPRHRIALPTSSGNTPFALPPAITKPSNSRSDPPAETVTT
ncbi:MAG: hypothetical protein DCC66_03075 [Planctomycetota bacterium]|nr:MAG: hypothetical protein DCC66_03075 [Planctomycetota bacterium]